MLRRAGAKAAVVAIERTLMSSASAHIVGVARFSMEDNVLRRRQTVLDRSSQQIERLVLNQLTDGSRAVDLVSVKGRGHKYDRPVSRSSADVDRNLNGHAAVAFADRESYIS